MGILLAGYAEDILDAFLFEAPDEQIGSFDGTLLLDIDDRTGA
jgi:hypothetical protein